MGSVLPAIAVSPKPLTDACTKIFARQNTAPCIADGKPFLLLEHGGKTEVSDLLDLYHVHPDIRFTTWEDFAIMAMVEKGMGISILPDLILKRAPYKSRNTPTGRAVLPLSRARNEKQKNLTPAVQKFIEYLPFRETE